MPDPDASQVGSGKPGRGDAPASGRGAFLLAALAVLVGLPWISLFLPLPDAQTLGDERTERYLPPVSRVWCVEGPEGGRHCEEEPSELNVTAGYPAPRPILHWLGTDLFGRDLLSRLMAAARSTTATVMLALLILLAMGTTAGLAASLVPTLDTAVSLVSDLLLSIPRLFLILLAVAFYRPEPETVAVLVAATSWMGVSRLVRAEARALLRRDYVPAALAAGASRLRLAAVHILPHLRGTLLAAAVLRLPDLLLLDAALGFLGLGAPPPAATLGGLMSGSGGSVHEAWWLGVFPGLWVAALALAFASLAERLHGIGEPEETSLL